jgi:hypothetical protein
VEYEWGRGGNTVNPHDDGIFRGFTPGLEEVEEEVSSISNI